VRATIFASPDWGAGAFDDPLALLCAFVCFLAPFVLFVGLITFGIRELLVSTKKPPEDNEVPKPLR
jgi:hypothetical protein